MNAKRKKALWQIGFGVALLVVAALSYWQGNSKSTISNFAECAAQGFPIMESYPRQCKTPNGETFREDIGNELEKDDLIRIESPRPNTFVSSPLAVKGMARGNWFFEASFPVRLIDASGVELGRGIAQAKGGPEGKRASNGAGWMTTDFVPFAATLTFTNPGTKTGTLVLEKDNPSGLPEHADELHIPISFQEKSGFIGDESSNGNSCMVTGCSNQVCAEEAVFTTCEYRSQYACYKSARCERQATGKCGWTETKELRSCLNQASDNGDTLH